MEVVFVYITAASADEALRIGRALVEARLAACVNVLDGMCSVYRWQGRIEEAAEAILIAKTRAELFAPLKARVLELHGYDCPCIVALPATAGHAPYLDWIRDETITAG